MLKAGVVAYQDRYCTLPCTIRNISEAGARLTSDSSLNVPDRFELVIEMDGLAAHCEVVWRKGCELGVKFLSALQKEPAMRIQVVNAVVPEAAPSLRRHAGPAERPEPKGGVAAQTGLESADPAPIIPFARDKAPARA